jgi:hypothetical protein
MLCLLLMLAVGAVPVAEMGAEVAPRHLSSVAGDAEPVPGASPRIFPTALLAAAQPENGKPSESDPPS